MSHDPEDRLKTALKVIHAREPAQPFEESWRRAAARAAGPERSGTLRWALGPTVIAVGAAVILALVTLPGKVDRSRTLALLDDLQAPDGGSAPSSVDDFAGEVFDDGDPWAVRDGPGKALYVGETDFFIKMDIPSWNEDGEGSVP